MPLDHSPEFDENSPIIHLKVTAGILWAMIAATCSLAGMAATAGYYFNDQVISRIGNLEKEVLDIRAVIQQNQKDHADNVRDRQDQINGLRDEVYEYIFKQKPPKEFRR